MTAMNAEPPANRPNILLILVDDMGFSDIDYYNPQPLVHDGRIIEGAEDFYTTDNYTQQGIDFLRRCAREDEPFFLHLCYNAPPWPLHAPPPARLRQSSFRSRCSAAKKRPWPERLSMCREIWKGSAPRPRPCIILVGSSVP